ncbi:DNA polymerase I [Sulfuriflexus mobilis]|uniref:DNA polymerase I n=1 Tax=Sulfuriflexus mobilis TaxID=1811807 RepID=UPI000F81918B|nr:DNA polymerase I [Sulfuriflexus mobilis]
MTKTTKKPLILVDGSSYLYRAFHAMPSLTNSQGQPTGAIYGVINMLRRLLREHEPQHIAVVFDAKGKTFRDAMYKEYKAHRPPMPDELRGQIQPIHDIIKAMGLPILVVDGVEADDVIGTLAVEASRQGMPTLISTGDKDMAQLVDDSVTLVNTMTELVSDPAMVEEKFGVRPDQIIDYLTLIGDKVDNVPGVPKVGPKTAVKWLAEYGDLETIMANADQIKGKVGEYLRDSLEQLPLSKQLVTIKCDVELGDGPNSLQRQPVDSEALRELYSQFEFKTWLAESLESGDKKHGNPAANATKAEYVTVLKKKEFNAWLKQLQAAGLFAFDTETTSLDYMQAEIVGVSFAIESGKAAYVPVAHDYEGAPVQLERDWVLEQLRPLLENPKQAKLGQNLKYDMNVLANYGIRLQGIAHDTMLESYVLDSTATRHDMDSLALKYLSYKAISYEDVAGKGKSQVTFNKVDLETAAPYAAEDADITLRLHESLWPRLKGDAPLQSVYRDMEIPLVTVLADIERNGVLVDAKMLGKQSELLATRLMEIEAAAYNEAGEEFNLSSPKQIQTILFEKQGLPVLKKTPKGQPSTAENVLQELAEDYDFALPKLILEHRGLSKLKSTYTDKLPLMINAKTGRVHTSYHQAVAATGRLSSSDPNLQNIPVRSEEGRRIRQAFIAPKGHKIVAADYSQIELRIMAHLSGDQGLLTAFAEGEDVHRATAAEVFGVGRDAVTSGQRRSAKAINFGLIYGMSAFGLARQLDVSRGEAQNYIDLYFARYPGVKNFMEETRERAREQGYVETVFGRRLYVPDIKASNMQRRQYAERTAINAPMQGTAADIIKHAMIACANWIGRDNRQVRMIMQVHDELVFEIAEAAADEAVGQITACMSQAAELAVPLEVSVGMGKNWDEAH